MFRNLILATLSTALLTIATMADAPAKKDGDIAVKINETTKITTAEVNRFIDGFLRMQGVPPEQADQLRGMVWQQALDQLIAQKLLLEATKDAKIELEDGAVDKFFEERLPPGTTRAEVAQMEGMTEEELTNEIARNMRIQKLLNSKTANVGEPTDEDLKALFEERVAQMPEYANTPEEVEARHILIKVEKDADDATRQAAKEKIAALRGKIVDDKADFAKIAEESSDCPSGKSNGGNLGYFKRGQMVPPFEEAAFTQEKGAVGEIIETDFGYHIVEVLNKKEASKRTFESEREELTAAAGDYKKGKVVESFIDELKAVAKIDVLITAPPAQ